jgi:hypothetical protein
MDGFIALSTFAGLDFSRMVNLTSLLVLPFADEDIAIVAGARRAGAGRRRAKGALAQTAVALVVSAA